MIQFEVTIINYMDDLVNAMFYLTNCIFDKSYLLFKLNKM